MISIGNIIDNFINKWGIFTLVVVCVALSTMATTVNIVTINDIKEEIKSLKSEAIKRDVACWVDDNGKPKFAWKEVR